MLVLNSSGRTRPVGKTVRICLCAFALLCLTTGVATANPSREHDLLDVLSETAIVPVEEESHPEERLGLSTVKGILKTEENAFRKGEVRLNSEAREHRIGPSAVTPVEFNGPIGRRSTNSLPKPDDRPAPALLLIKEITDQGVLYLGVLGLTIPW
jgi:hypothetical protein